MQTNMCKILSVAPAITASCDRLKKYRTQKTNKQKAVLVQTLLFIMSSYSQNDQQNSLNHWSIASLSEKKDLSVFMCYIWVRCVPGKKDLVMRQCTRCLVACTRMLAEAR